MQNVSQMEDFKSLLVAIANSVDLHYQTDLSYCIIIIINEYD